MAFLCNLEFVCIVYMSAVYIGLPLHMPSALSYPKTVFPVERPLATTVNNSSVWLHTAIFSYSASKKYSIYNSIPQHSWPSWPKVMQWVCMFQFPAGCLGIETHFSLTNHFHHCPIQVSIPYHKLLSEFKTRRTGGNHNMGWQSFYNSLLNLYAIYRYTVWENLHFIFQSPKTFT